MKKNSFETDPKSVLFRRKFSNRFELGKATKIPRYTWMRSNVCEVMQNNERLCVTSDDVIEVEQLMKAQNTTNWSKNTLTSNSFRGFTILNAFFINSVVEGMSGAISTEIHFTIEVTSGWQRAFVVFFIQTCITFVTFVLFHILWGFGPNMIASVPNIVLTPEAARAFFGVKVNSDEEFVITESNSCVPKCRFQTRIGC